MPTLNLDTAGALDIIITQGNSFDIVIDHFEADGVTPRPLTGTHKMVVFGPGGQAVGRFEQPTDITVASNRLTISRTSINNTLPAGSLQYYIYSEQAGNKTLPMWKGKLEVNKYVK
jgi:hypothetical protein